MNVSTADDEILGEIGLAVGNALIDTHRDAHHNRAVLTLVGEELDTAVRTLARAVVGHLDLRRHRGVHPRLGVLDVVPFVPIARAPGAPLDGALRMRDAFAAWAGEELGLPCFCYGPERSLPEVRRRAFVSLSPDYGPVLADPATGACCVGAREALVAYNLILQVNDLARARAIAAGLRSAQVRALGLQVGDEVQVSCNLIDPFRFGPEACFDAVAAQAPIRRAELVGLVPDAVYRATDPQRRGALDLEPERTIEARAGAAGYAVSD